MRAARLTLLLSVDIQLVSYRNQDLIHCDPEEVSERVEVVYRRKALTPLPFVDRLGFLEAEVLLKVPHGQSTFDAKPLDVVPRGNQIDHGVVLQEQKHRPFIMIAIREHNRMLRKKQVL